jgi:hypothetical protein
MQRALLSLYCLLALVYPTPSRQERWLMSMRNISSAPRTVCSTYAAAFIGGVCAWSVREEPCQTGRAMHFIRY